MEDIAMKVFEADAPPARSYEYTSKASLDRSYDLVKLRKRGATVVAYWYRTRGYEGSGQLIARINGKWFTHDLGHCSCYGAVDHFSTERGEGVEKLDDLTGSKEWLELIAPVVKVLKSKRYK